VSSPPRVKQSDTIETTNPHTRDSETTHSHTLDERTHARVPETRTLTLLYCKFTAEREGKRIVKIG